MAGRQVPGASRDEVTGSIATPEMRGVLIPGWAGVVEDPQEER